jgi:hypothetical protein
LQQLAPIFPKIGTVPFRWIGNVALQALPHDSIEFVGISQMIFHAEVKALGHKRLRPVSVSEVTRAKRNR